MAKKPASPHAATRKGGKVNVWAVVQDLLAGSPMSIAEMHRGYKGFLRNYYAADLAAIGKRHYRIINHVKVYFSKPPKGMTYLSFARVVNKWENTGLVQKTGVKGAAQYVTPGQTAAGIQLPSYYELTGSGHALAVSPQPKVKPVAVIPPKPVKKAAPAKAKQPAKPASPQAATPARKAPAKPVAPRKKRGAPKEVLTMEEKTALTLAFVDQQGRSPTQAEAQEIFGEEIKMRAAERERDQLVNDLDTILNDNRKAASAQDMLKFMETADEDKYEGFEEVRDAVQNYQDAARDEKEDAFEDIRSTIQDIEVRESHVAGGY